MLIRTLSALFAAVLIGLVIPVVSALVWRVDFGGPGVFWTVVVGGGLVGAYLGWRFPKVFGFLFECIID